MRISLVILALLSLSADPASAQRRVDATKITSPLRHRGTYHVADGTWSRANPASATGGIVVYNNRAPSGYYFQSPADWTTVDHGRLPSTSSPSSPTSVAGDRDSYDIRCFEIAYCSDIPPVDGSVAVETSFFDRYSPCSDVDLPGVGPVATFLATGLPPGSTTGGLNCWVMAFDLTNTTLVFDLNGDGEGSWDGDANIDSFGWSMTYLTPPSPGSPVGTGPVIAGKCPGPGGATTPQQGFGTAFGGTPGATDSTGLGTDDFFWIDDNRGHLTPNANGGCFFFGGCTGPLLTGSDHNPFGGFWLELFAWRGDGLGTSYCDSLPNATGSHAVLELSGTDVNLDLGLTAGPVPNTTGLFFYGPMMLAGTTSLGDGLRCVGGSTTRMLPSVSAGMMMQPPNGAVFVVDYAAPYAQGLTGTQHFQYWFRSGLGMGTGSNTSNAITISF